MKYAKAEKINISLRDGDYNYHVLTINDPCLNESDIPNSVTSFNCNNSKTSNGKHTPSGRLIVGILHNSRLCSQSDLDKINTSKVTGKFCRERNSTEPDKLRGGMGDKGNVSQKEYLKNKYNNLTNSRTEFHNTEIYNKYKRERCQWRSRI